jgi:progesterone-induced-blocking factor 1
MADLRIQIRLKTEDAERSQNMYEEANANCKATKLENEMIREKLNVLKAEFYKSEV